MGLGRKNLMMQGSLFLFGMIMGHQWFGYQGDVRLW